MVLVDDCFFSAVLYVPVDQIIKIKLSFLDYLDCVYRDLKSHSIAHHCRTSCPAAHFSFGFRMNPEIFKTTSPTLSVLNRPYIQEGVLGALQAFSGLSLNSSSPQERDGFTFKTKFDPVANHNGFILTLSVKSEKGGQLNGPLEMKYNIDLKDMKMLSNGFQSWSQAREFDSNSRIQKIRSSIAWYTQYHLQG